MGRHDEAVVDAPAQGINPSRQLDRAAQRVDVFTVVTTSGQPLLLRLKGGR